MEENGSLRRKFKKLNIQYLNIVQEAGSVQEPAGYGQTVFNLDGDTINLLMSLDIEAKRQIAAVGAPLFRLNPKDLKKAGELYEKGNGKRAASILSAALAAEGAQKDET